MWAQELYARSGVGFGVLAPLTFATVREWANAMRGGEMPSGREIRALMRIDEALRGSGSEDKAKSDPVTDDPPPWPEKKTRSA